MGRTLKTYADWRQAENFAEYDFYYMQFKRLLTTMFDWSNLPKGMSERFLEQALFQNGLVIMFESKEGKTKGNLIISKATPIGFNLYNDPVGYRAYSENGIVNEYVKAVDCVPIWNNYDKIGSVTAVNFFAKRLSGIEKTIDCNMEQLKTPTLISCNENQRETVKAIWTKKTNGEPLILVDDGGFDMNQVKVFDLQSQNHIPELSATKREWMCEALTYFGINNTPVAKKERLITSESEQNNQQIIMNQNVLYKPRKIAVEAINDLFGTDIRVDVSESLETIVSNMIGGVKDGTVHNDSV